MRCIDTYCDHHYHSSAKAKMWVSVFKSVIMEINIENNQLWNPIHTDFKVFF